MQKTSRGACEERVVESSKWNYLLAVKEKQKPKMIQGTHNRAQGLPLQDEFQVLAILLTGPPKPRACAQQNPGVLGANGCLLPARGPQAGTSPGHTFTHHSSIFTEGKTLGRA